ncbi:type II toxin-antitoxin system RelB/DinJ family antitoxin [uncultured Treponema sp.]|uniref:type II toxin-antitoxin system RelB/DinJ family antitoxin n=1 Tax=uncultured Treponema sp. TaxID=162155 RepID=UPI0025CC8396|nr:type II toxin-antitoxin system RelB/DinJ family antitoxin [uncultured Treponema sp.]
MTTLSIKIDDTDKLDFENICKEIGLNITSAVTAFVKATIRENGIPFALKAKEPAFYSAENMKVLSESIAQDRAGNTVKHSLEEIME